MYALDPTHCRISVTRVAQVSDCAAQGRLVSIARYTLAASPAPTPAAAAPAAASLFASSFAPSADDGESEAPKAQARDKRVTATVYTHGSGTEPSFPAAYEVLRWDLLHLMDMSGNSNKYYSIELHEADDTSVVHRYASCAMCSARSVAFPTLSCALTRFPGIASSRTTAAPTRSRRPPSPAPASAAISTTRRTLRRSTLAYWTRRSILKRGTLLLSDDCHILLRLI